MSNTFKGFKIKGIETNQSGQYVLVTTEPSLLDPQGITRHITLWSRRDGQVEERSIENTTQNLRRELNENGLIFSDPSDYANYKDNPMHIENWVKNNIDKELENVYLTKSGYFTLAAPNSGNFTTRKFHPYRRVYKGEGQFDPETQYLSFKDAFEESDLLDFIEALQPVDEAQNLGGSIVKTNNYVGLKFNGKVVDVNYDSGNARNIPKVEDAPTRQDVLNKVLNTLNTMVDDNGNKDEVALAAVNALPENYAFAELLDILGGYDCAYLTVENARLVLSKYLEKLVKWALVIYVQPEGLESIMRPTRLKLPWYQNILPTDPKKEIKKEYKRQELSFEYLHGDFTNRDFLLFLEKAKANVTGIVQPVLQKMGYLTPNGLKELDPQEALQVLLAIIKHGTVNAKLSATLANAKGPADLTKLGVTPTHLLFENVNIDEIKPLDQQDVVENVKIELPDNTQPVVNQAASPFTDVTNDGSIQETVTFADLPSADQFDDDLPF